MNRKLVNGLLLLSVATAACGTFTSCKDTDEDYKNEIMVDLNGVKMDLNDVKKRLSDLEQKYPSMQSDIQKILAYLGATDASQLNGTVADLIKQLIDKNVNPNKVYGLVGAVLQQIEAQVTDVILNQTYNPIFGTLNLPVGLNSTLLANYYGESLANVSFPFATANAEVGDVEGVEENAAELAALGFERVSVVAGTPYMDGTDNNNLGQLYVTVNPLGLDLDKYSFTLVNSQDEVAPVTLTPEITDEVLTHGYTRALTSKNGFYRVNAKADINSLKDLSIRIEPGLKSAFKDFIQSPSKQDLADLGIIIFKQLDGFLPAYGIKATWNVNGVTSADATLEGKLPEAEATKSAVSKYEIAATAFQPLGYEFLQDVSISKRLPTYGPVSDAVNRLLQDIKAQAKIDFTSSSLKIDATSIIIELDGLKDGNGQPIVDENGKVPTIVLGYDPASGKVSDKGNLTALNPLVGQIVEQVNSMLSNMQGDINDQLASIVDKIQNRLKGKLGAADKLLSKYNALASKVNHFLAAPNDYLQVSLAMKGFDGNLYRVSTNPDDPTTVAGTGAGELYLTSPTAELIVPAYKKAVANLTTGKILGDGVLSGRQTSIAIQASDLAEGLNKIVYSALDYRGKTSTRFFYIYKK